MFKKTKDNTFEFHTKNFLIQFVADEYDTNIEEVVSCLEEEEANNIIAEYKEGDLLLFNSSVELFFKDQGKLILLSERYISNCTGNIYESFMDHFGLGYSTALRLLQKNPPMKDLLQKRVDFFEKYGRNMLGSQFRDLVSQCVEDARNHEQYSELIKKAKTIHNISNF